MQLQDSGQGVRIGDYPVLLAIGPAAYALAAGNRVLIKPSELF